MSGRGHIDDLMAEVVSALTEDGLRIAGSAGLCCDPRDLLHLMLESGRAGGPDDEAIEVTEEQVIAILREQEAGAKTADVCRRHGISSATFYAWKAKFGGMDVSDVKRLRALEEENAKLKRLYADAMLDNSALKELLAKRW